MPSTDRRLELKAKDIDGSDRLTAGCVCQWVMKWCISTAMGETDEVMLWNGSKEDGNVQSECKEDEGTDCEDGDNDTDW